jgi:hypothetical protein
MSVDGGDEERDTRLREAGDSLVEQSLLPVRRTLAKLGISQQGFIAGTIVFRPTGPESLEDQSPQPGRVWNRIGVVCVPPRFVILQYNDALY